jgi:putative exporter of polyketide antibiotics
MMTTLIVVGIVGVLVVVVALTEVVAAAVPLLLVITMVPPQERAQLAELIAATDRTRRLRLWPALRAAIAARRHREQSKS